MFKGLLAVIGVFLVIVALGIALNFLGLFLLPYQRNLETYANRANQGYVTTQQNNLTKLEQQYADLDVEIAKRNGDPNDATVQATISQERAIVKEYERIVNVTPAEQITSEERSWLSQHRGL